MITKRNVAVAILLSIVTCGIYGIYWFIKITDEVNFLTHHEGDTSGAIAFLLTIVTCGIYGFFWAYKIGDKLDNFEGTSSSRGVIYLILNIFGLGIITYALVQDSINKLA